MPCAEGQSEELRRAKIRARRRATEAVLCMDAVERSDRSLEILRRLLALPEYAAARHILAYASLPDEVATGEILAAALESDRTIAIPAAENAAFVLAAGIIADPALDLVTGPFGVPVPRPGRPRVRLTEVDLVIVPGRAFDCAGGRVGRGCGYYDRLLFMRELSRAAIFGFAFDCQLCDEPVPRNEKDFLLPAIITESGVRRFR